MGYISETAVQIIKLTARIDTLRGELNKITDYASKDANDSCWKQRGELALAYKERGNIYRKMASYSSGYESDKLLRQSYLDLFNSDCISCNFKKFDDTEFKLVAGLFHNANEFDQTKYSKEMSYMSLLQHMIRGENKAVYDLCEKLVNENGPEVVIAQFILGTLYEYGIEVKKDIEKAVELYEKAAARGNAGAIYRLAQCYEFGRGVLINIEKAAELYEKAAAQGNADALTCLAQCYEFGRGVLINIEKAAELYEKAAAQGGGDANTQHALGRYYERIKGSRYVAVFHYYEQAANQGIVEAQYDLGRCEESARSINKAIKLYETAAKQKTSVELQGNIQFALFRCFWVNGEVQDIDKAAYHLHQAVCEGNGEAKLFQQLLVYFIKFSEIPSFQDKVNALKEKLQLFITSSLSQLKRPQQKIDPLLKEAAEQWQAYQKQLRSINEEDEMELALKMSMQQPSTLFSDEKKLLQAYHTVSFKQERSTKVLRLARLLSPPKDGNVVSAQKQDVVSSSEQEDVSKAVSQQRPVLKRT